MDETCVEDGHQATKAFLFNFDPRLLGEGTGGGLQRELSDAASEI